MTVNKDNFYNWQHGTRVDEARFRKASPNLGVLKGEVMKRWGGTSLGLLSKRTIRGGSDLSSHFFGAAWDWRYPSRAKGLEVIKFIVANSEELGVQAIHDYVGSTIWRAGRGWKKQSADSSGMGQKWATWIHVETTKSDWGNSKSFAARGIILP